MIFNQKKKLIKICIKQKKKNKHKKFVVNDVKGLNILFHFLGKKTHVPVKRFLINKKKINKIYNKVTKKFNDPSQKLIKQKKSNAKKKSL